MKIDFEIRPALEHDWPALWPLLLERGHTDGEGPARERFSTLIREKEHCLLVAALDGRLLGYAWAQDYGPHLRSGKRTARFHDLFVAPERRRLGVGAGLFEEIKSWAARARVSWLQWQAAGTAVPFYERLGLKGDTRSDLDEFPFFEIEFPTASTSPRSA